MEENWQKILHRRKDINKYDLGHVLVVGGSDGMEGAPMLVAEAAMRIGAGLVTIASTSEVVGRIAGEIEEVMTLAAIADDIQASCSKLSHFIEQRSVKAVVVGSGMCEESHEFIRRFMARVDVPMVIDAGALRALSGQEEATKVLTEHSKSCIFTPHSGEFAGLIGQNDVSVDDAIEFADIHGTVLVLKGSPTYVAAPGYLHENTTGTPALATAGTGDALAGMIAGVVVQGVAPSEAAQMAVYAHGLAGELAVGQKTEAGVMAGDVIEMTPQALRRIELMLAANPENAA